MEEMQTTKIDPRLGQHIRELRKERGLTIKELSEIVGCSTTHITRIELGQRRIDSMSLMIAFSHALNVPTEELLSISGQSIQQSESLVRVAFPSISTDQQEMAITEIASLITGNELTSGQLQHLIDQAVAYAEYCDRKNK
ncbi:MAG: helix-turn-helix transcriptional regulator [Ruminococcus flavefaciens]|nr:helix-turn-helix transcriptional regulator [Ruminococcus flavefaciens]